MRLLTLLATVLALLFLSAAASALLVTDPVVNPEAGKSS